MKCIQCGKKVEQEQAVLCNECFGERHTSLKHFTPHTLLICPTCHSFQYQKEWKHHKPKEEAIREAVLHHCDFHFQPDAVDLDILLHDEHGAVQTGIVTLRTETVLDGQKLLEEFQFPLKVKASRCNTCSRVKTQYYEGVLQLRGGNKQTLAAAHAFILSEAERIKEKGVFITKIEEVTNGIDYYYTKQQYLPILTNKLVEKFGAVGKTHGELFSKSRQTSKDIYRVNASVRLPDYGIGTVIGYKGKIFQLVGVGKYLTALDLKTGKKLTITDMENIDIKVQPDDFKSVQITKQYPHLEVLHPETFQSVSVENASLIDTMDSGRKEVSIVLIDEKIWVVQHFQTC
jgi:NMD protein affecting ribosome stability and mRNA decay